MMQIPNEKRLKVNLWLQDMKFQGSLIIDSALPSEHQGMLSHLRRYATRRIAKITDEDSLKPNIYFDFVDDPRFNAVATVLDHDYLILVNSRVILETADLFRNLFALPRFAPQIGNPSLECELDIRSVSVAARGASIIDIMPHPPRIPNCPTRELVASIFAQNALEFLILHELGHIRNGHRPYLSDFRPHVPALLAEAEAPSNDQGDALLARHTFEMDADSHAIVHGVNELLGLIGSTWSAPDRKPLEQVYGTPERALYAYILTIYALLRCFGKESWSPQTIWKSTHPPPEIRQCTLPMLLHAKLSRNGKELLSIDKMFEIATDVIIEVERSFSFLTGVIADLSGFTRAMRYWSTTYGRQINEYWIRAFPRLDNLKLGGRLAPPDPWRDHNC
jgi:hypothetical protein